MNLWVFLRRFAPAVHAPECPGVRGTWERKGCGRTFVCALCGRRFGACCGGADDLPDHCDTCWGLVHDSTPISVGGAT